MNIFNPTATYDIGDGLRCKLEIIRNFKKFNSREYIDAKVELLNKYMQHFKLSTCIVAVSGGIDSAIVLGLVKYASTQRKSPITNIIPVLLPALNTVGVTGQDASTCRGEDLCRSLNLNPTIINLEKLSAEFKSAVESKTTLLPGKAWASGQLIPCLRTPVLYYLANLATEMNLPAIICGTTNKDEGAYLGYVGKASDGMVDVQLISDLHKSEVYAVGKKFNLPSSVMTAIPTGDMHDGRCDEEVFGASYDFVELYLNYLTCPKKGKIKWIKSLTEDEKRLFKMFARNLENLHDYNSHKYLARSPAVHLDLIPNRVPGEWGVPSKPLKALLHELRK
jgi:NAD+ synthetase